MKIFKFGGASLKDAPALKNMIRILQKDSVEKEVLIVVSAMGKMTNAFETLLKSYWEKEDYQTKIISIYDFHQTILRGLFCEEDDIFTEIERIFQNLRETLRHARRWKNYDKLYDHVVSFGEVISSTIVQHYLQKNNISCTWIDARKMICTDNTWREGRVNWEKTQENISQTIPPILQKQVVVTQGFISGYQTETTTLGREGSDFSAAIFACCLQAKALTIWKDVPGVLNADPKRVPDAQLYATLSYAEAAEMSRYGASVIHPKTIAPLIEDKIKLYVRSFLQPQQPGTCINSTYAKKFIPTIIFKEKQVLIHFDIQDFNFITEERIADIFMAIARTPIKVNLTHITGSRFSICTDDRSIRIEKLTHLLAHEFAITRIEGLELITIKNGDSQVIQQITEKQKIILEERGEYLYQAVVYKNK